VGNSYYQKGESNHALTDFKALNYIIQDVQMLTYEERHTLLEYLTNQVVSKKKEARAVIQLGGVLGSLTVSADDDPIAEALDELAKERAISFDREWSWNS